MRKLILSAYGIGLTILSYVVGIIPVRFVLAADRSIPTIQDTQDISSFRLLFVCFVANSMFWILMTLVVIFVVWAAYLYLFSQGEESKIESARKTLTYAAVAVVVALMAKGFPSLIASIFDVPALTGCVI